MSQQQTQPDRRRSLLTDPSMRASENPGDNPEAYSDYGIDEFDLLNFKRDSETGWEDDEGDDEDSQRTEPEEEDTTDAARLVRMLYQLPFKNSELSFKMSVIVNYMRQHQLDVVLPEVISKVLSEKKLPYNPHAVFHRALKVRNSTVEQEKLSKESIHNALNMTTTQSDISYLSKISKSNNVWGLSSVIRTMSPGHLKEFEWLLGSITPHKTTLVYHDGFSCQAIMSIVGPSAFYGSFYPDVPSIIFRLHYVVMGEDDQELALKIWAESVLNDVFYAMNQNEHLLLGLYIENANCGGYKTFETDRYFTPSFIEDNEQIILDELYIAARGAQKVSAEMIFLLDPDLMTYKRGQKQYECYFIDHSVDDQEDPEIIFGFAEYFMATVYEGCFLRKHEGEAYMGLFCSREILVNFDGPPVGLQPNVRSNLTHNKRIPFKDVSTKQKQKQGQSSSDQQPLLSRQPRAEIDEPIERSEQIQINQELELELGFKSRVLKDEKASRSGLKTRHKEKGAVSNSRFLSAYSYIDNEKPVSPVWNHGIVYPDNRTKPVLNQRGGFKVTAEQRKEEVRPDSRYIKEPLRTHFERNIVQLDYRNREFFEQVHKLILLNLMDKTSSEEQILIPLYKILNGHGWKVMCVMMKNMAIQEAIYAYRAERVSIDIINLEFKRYREELNYVLGSDLQEKSSDYESLLMKCNFLLDQLYTKQELPDPSSHEIVPLTIVTIETLRSVNSMIEAQLIWSMENVQNDQFPVVMSAIEKLQLKYPNDAERPPTPIVRRERGQRFEPKTKWKPPSHQVADNFKHGNEFKFIMDQDETFIVRKDALAKSTFPNSVKLDAVFMQYLIDTRVDQVWKDYVVEIACSPVLPPNPWPRLITAFREAALKMELFFEYEEDILKRAIDINAGKVADRENFIYKIPSTKIFAHKTILPIVSAPHATKVIDYAQMFDNKQFPQSIGQFKIASTLALVGHTFLYGNINPYLGTLELDEHVFFKGPTGCWFEALQHYCGLIWSHIEDLDSAYRTVTGTFMGYKEKRMSLVDTLARPKAFKAELEHYLRRKEPVYIKTFVVEAWRYIPVVKWLKFHYVNENETDRELFFEDDWAHLHTNMFWLKSKASFHFQQAGPPLQQDPSNPPNKRNAINDINKRIKKAQKEVDYPSAYRWLCTRSLLDESFEHVASCWRMSNSTVGMLEYCNVLNKSLQELILYAMESPYEEEKSPLKSVSLGMMGNAYRFKIDKSLERVGALAPSNLDELTFEKLQETMEWDEISHNAFVKIEDRTLEILREVYDLTRGVIVAVSYDINSICEKSAKAINDIKLRENPYFVGDEVTMTTNTHKLSKKKADEWRNYMDASTAMHTGRETAFRMGTAGSTTSSKKSNRPKYDKHPYIQTKDPFPNI